MLKLIRLMPGRDLYTVQGFGVQAGKIPVGSLADAASFLAGVGVPKAEIRIAQKYLDERREHNAVEFGVIRLWATCTMLVDTSEFLLAMGLPTVDAYFAEGVRPCA